MKETKTIKEMFDNIVGSYDFLNHTLSFFQDYYWRYQMFRELLPLKEGLVMDLATGTGDSAKGVLKRGCKVLGVDLSFKMLYKTKKKLKGENFIPLTASGYELPFKSDTFSAITCAFGIRNMHDTVNALKEIRRVLKKGGKVVFLEFCMPEGVFKHPYRLYLKRIMPLMASLFSRKEAYDYLYHSIENFPKPDEFSDLLMSAGFNGYKRKPLSFGTVYIHRAHKF
ncbi:MAG: bifunctional demethylmenaquinone methyltransferase/2-methoxy-6-polyprenyl-1,4-benzoquinol methylase UbiE [bacterium]